MPMTAMAMLKLPPSVRMDEVPALWAALQASLRAEAAALPGAAGSVVQISLAELQRFDSSVLSLLLSAARLATAEGMQLRVGDAPVKLRELARVYGVAELLGIQDLQTA
jgi:phospholipid transport system transporter-binding protein